MQKIEIKWEERSFEGGDAIGNKLARTMMSDFREQFVKFNTRFGKLLDVVIAHRDTRIECKLEENKPDNLDHQWLRMEMIREEKVQNN